MKLQLVDDWTRNWWRRWSVQLALAMSTLTVALLQNQGLVMSLLSYLPAKGPSRLLAVLGIALMVFIIPTITVLLKQPKLGADGNAKPAA